MTSKGVPKTSESRIRSTSPESYANNLLTNPFFPLTVSKSVNVAANTLLVYGSRAVRSRKVGVARAAKGCWRFVEGGYVPLLL